MAERAEGIAQFGVGREGEGILALRAVERDRRDLAVEAPAEMPGREGREIDACRGRLRAGHDRLVHGADFHGVATVPPSNDTGAIGPQSTRTAIFDWRGNPRGTSALAPRLPGICGGPMSARINDKDRLPRFDPVELGVLLLGVAALTAVAVML